jgi:hypothetical protein
MTGSQTGGTPAPQDDQGDTRRGAGRPGGRGSGRVGDGSAAAAAGRSASGETPTNPMLAMLSAMQSMSEAALASLTPGGFPAGLGPVGEIGQAQWQSMLEAMSTMSQLPLANLDQAVREVARLREAISVMQLQLEGFDHQLAALEAVIRPLHQWARAWRPKT